MKFDQRIIEIMSEISILNIKIEWFIKITPKIYSMGHIGTILKKFFKPIFLDSQWIMKTEKCFKIGSEAFE